MRLISWTLWSGSEQFAFASTLIPILCLELLNSYIDGIDHEIREPLATEPWNQGTS